MTIASDEVYERAGELSDEIAATGPIRTGMDVTALCAIIEEFLVANGTNGEEYNAWLCARVKAPKANK